jgi:hypothetical protein
LPRMQEEGQQDGKEGEEERQEGEDQAGAR